MVDCRDCKRYKGIIKNTHYFLCEIKSDEEIMDIDYIATGHCDAYVPMDSNDSEE